MTKAPAARGRSDFKGIHRAMNLNAATNEHGATAELHRLRQGGLIDWWPRKMIWTISPEHASGLAKLISGRAFVA